ncbi:MAG: hypothetical protein KZQ64_14505 [gamma proteobacterium symbiont of Bathyaustriella thionipta]|nr:hypothetical protein [gamma proteobacterium symbiont of Bathyaustriella thionipta]MCU7950695.1 hypothetical protein [gamma proteobacterium symbiont of Bathyaustriella thionipta]MCU7954580.1 hypothetical protein [gamma proteobacterium symbiont of Bathyaustriella thionipta]MCU7957198.1 hypothetical protein [gamma proteobacterium symbiont of Bathyaustriella thionipta]MCU7968257.1 hypothetical protein [gamma proteobacterium symbiont of Bathyaustriella thionipta]
MSWRLWYQPQDKPVEPVVDHPVVQWQTSPVEVPQLYCRFFVQRPGLIVSWF